MWVGAVAVWVVVVEASVLCGAAVGCALAVVGTASLLATVYTGARIECTFGRDGCREGIMVFYECGVSSLR